MTPEKRKNVAHNSTKGGSSHHLEWTTQVQFLKGVGPRFADVLSTRGIKTIGDLLEWYPRAYEDRRAARNIKDLKEGEIVSLTVSVMKVASHFLGNSKRKMYEVLLKDTSGMIWAKFFRVPYKGYFERFQIGQLVRVVGKVTSYRGRLEFHHPDLRDESALEEISDQLVALYTETEGITLSRLRNMIKIALEELKGKIPESLPKSVIKNEGLISREEMLNGLHLPPNNAGTEFNNFRSAYHYRLIFEEFFWMELLLAHKKQEFVSEVGIKIPFKESLLQNLIQELPFPLTQAQNRVINEILADIKTGHPMHRLVQGDVGSGKTAVAFISAHLVAQAGYQSAIMAPTEILANQHLKNFTKLFPNSNLKIELLTGSQTKSEKNKILEKLKSGEINILVGTHALIEDNVEFRNLGFVVIDEQHRFGVEQRKALRNKGALPHFLLMTATPIPRTLAMTVYGDLDVSVIDEMPPGRTPIVTRVTGSSKENLVYGFILDQLKLGRQAYIIYPLVEESEKIDLKNATDEHIKLQTVFSGFKVALLHGKMKPEEKESVMKEFRNGNLHVLVSTTVIEVGVDVPNATVMLVEHSERFGLSQLHQLRGRVGRGSHKSYCIFKLGNAVSDEARNRVNIMEKTNDGFKVAEADLEIRGPGEFLGTRQSGLTGFKMANLVRDMEILLKARTAAFDFLLKDPKNPEIEVIRKRLKQSSVG